MKLLISTAAFPNKSGVDTAKIYIEEGLPGVELSGGIFSKTAERDIQSLQSPVPVFLHNYFPPPQESFVFNLASEDKDILERSKELVRRALALSKQIGADVFSFHSGFLFDPRPEQLGRIISRTKLDNREIAKLRFIQSVLQLADEANSFGVRLLIENNVLSSENFEAFGENPFLLVTPEETIEVMTELQGKVGLLLDVGHLKVSSKSLGFDLVAAHQDLSKYIEGYHLHDNLGQSDSHSMFRENSWFWSNLSPKADYFSLEVHTQNIDHLREQVLLARKFIGLNEE